MAEGFDYKFVQELVDFGRGLGAELVGQPFKVYRLNPDSTGNIVVDDNLVIADYRAKVTRTRQTKLVENDYLHTNPFEFLADASLVNVGDVLVQNDDTYGGNAAYAVASKRPLKALICVRCETFAKIYRPASGQDEVPRRSNYSGPTFKNRRPYVLNNGLYTVGDSEDAPAIIPVGLQSIGQLKGLKPERLPLDVTTSWWFVYLPALVGLDRIRDGDIIEQPAPYNDEAPRRFRVNVQYTSAVGLQGHFLACDKVSP